MVHRDPGLVASAPVPDSSVSSQQQSSAGESARSTVTLSSGRVLVRAKPKAKAKPPAPRRYYVVTSGPADLLGIWHAQWSHLASHLPGGKLFGSGCVLSGHDDLDIAKDKWFAKWESEPPIHTQP